MEDRLKILLIDDDEVDRMAVKRALRRSGVKADLAMAENGTDGLEVLDREEVDFIILDYRLPDYTGIELLEKIRSREILAPVIVVTSHGDESIATESMKSGASDYMSKDSIQGKGLGTSIRNLMKVKEGEEKRRAAERELKATKNRLQMVVMNSAVSLFSVDAQGIVTLSEGKDADYLGLSPGTAVGQSIFEVKKLQVAGFCEKTKAALSGESVNFEMVLTGRWFEVSLSPVCDSSGSVTTVIGVATDITERIRTQEELTKAKQLAEKSARVKEEFLANMSHEIRTPMNAIIGFTNLLTRTRLDPEQQEFVRSIEVAGENLLVLINDILDFSKIEAGKLTIEKHPFSLPDLLKDTYRLFSPKAAEKKLDFRLKMSNDLSGHWIGDQVRLNQILINLVGNAIKFTTEGWVELSVRRKQENGENWIRFKVKDTGIGIAKEKVNKVFDSFTQAATDTTRKFGGTGLGLSIVKQLVQLMDGRVWAESEMGKGSSFIFELPMQKAEGESESEAGIHPVREGLDFSSLEGVLVLMAEDNKMNQVLARRIMEDAGIDVVIAENGQIALDMVKKRDFDLILMDVQMPEMDGLATSRAIRELPAPAIEIPIIALTAHAVASEINKCLEAGMNDYVVKPYKPEHLLQKILEGIQEERQADQIPVESADAPQHSLQTFDPRLLEEVAGGNLGFELELIETFLTENLPALSEIEEARQAENPEKMAAILHRIKPGFEILGVNGAEVQIKQLETLLKSGRSWEEIDPLYTQLKIRAEKSGEEIRSWYTYKKQQVTSG